MVNMSAKSVIIVVAVANNGVIGLDNQLPWRLKSDLQRFKKLTMGHALIMGRKTFDSIGRLLPGRQTIIVTRNPELRIENALMASSLQDAIAKTPEGMDCFVIGGAEIFRQAMPHAQKMLVTRVLAAVEGDTYFEDWDRTEWELKQSSHYPATNDDDWPTNFEVWDRRATSEI